MPCKTPVVLIVFRRPELTRRVFERIREARPERLFVVADGPRMPEERSLCEQTRAETDAVDWPCDVSRSYSEQNLGARRRISSGLDRVFEQVEEAIILEDDCLPDFSFFGYCEALLERYRDLEQIFSISGDNFQRGQKRGEGSYFFSNYFHGWGWATWRRAWRHYDHDMTAWPAFRDGGGLEKTVGDPVATAYWKDFLNELHEHGKPDAWDYIWMLTGWMHRGLTVLPNMNLVENIGFGEGATNTTGQASWMAARPVETAGPMVHPATIGPDSEADRYIFDQVFPGNRLRREQCWKYRLRRRLWRIKQWLSADPVAE